MTTAIKVDDTELCDLERRARSRGARIYLSLYSFIEAECVDGEMRYWLGHTWNPEDPRSWERNRWLSRDEALALLCPEEATKQLEAKA